MRFSVIIPVYNKADTITESLNSVLNQTYDDFEIIVINDGSTDHFFETMKPFDSEPKVRIISQNNAGVSVARNTGIHNSQGDYICFLDADDLYLNNHLEILNTLIDKYPNCSYFATSHLTVMPNKAQYESSRFLKNFSTDFICDNLFHLLNRTSDGIINTNSVCVKRELFITDNIFFQPNEKIGEDTDVWFRIALKHSIVISKIITTVYQREFSTATAKTSNTLSWVFAKRHIKEMNISDDIKYECLKMIDRYKMTCSRDYLCSFNRKAAVGILKGVEYKCLKYYVSLVLCCLPYKLSQYLIAKL